MVVDSRAQASKRRGSKARDVIYTPVVEYSYRVNGQEFRSRQIGADDQGEDTLADAEKIVGKFPKGANVAVYFDPNSPGNAMLEAPPADRPDRKALIAAILSIAVAICAQAFFGVRPRRAARRVDIRNGERAASSQLWGQTTKRP